jgi:TPR repeat protein
LNKLSIEESGSAWLDTALLYLRQGNIDMATKCTYQAEKYAPEWGCLSQYDLGMLFRNVDMHHRAIYWLIVAARNGDPDAAKDISTLYGIELNIE